MTKIIATGSFANLNSLIDQAGQSDQPILIEGEKSNAILLSAENWQAIQETLYLLAVPGMRESILDAKAEPLSESAKDLDW